MNLYLCPDGYYYHCKPKAEKCSKLIWKEGELKIGQRGYQKAFHLVKKENFKQAKIQEAKKERAIIAKKRKIKLPEPAPERRINKNYRKGRKGRGTTQKSHPMTLSFGEKLMILVNKIMSKLRGE